MDFQQTVNLRDTMERPAPTPALSQTPKRPAPAPAPEPPRPAPNRRPAERAEAIDEVYRNDGGGPIERIERSRRELQSIERPPVPAAPAMNRYRLIIGVLGVALAAALLYGLFFRDKGQEPAANAPVETKWYAVKLLSGETFYGEVGDIAANPVMLKNVYYNYEQLQGEAPSETGSLKLVKRGKETHGPDGTMSIYQTQIVLIEPLGEESKVLKAIRDFEKE